MEIKLELTQTIDIASPSLQHIVKAFVQLIPLLFEKAVSQTLHAFAQKMLDDGTLAKALGVFAVKRKTFTGRRTTKVFSPFGRINVPKFQVQNILTGKRTCITRFLLGMEPYRRIPHITRTYLGLMGALAPLRVVNKFFQMYTGTQVSLMEIVRSIRYTGTSITLEIDSGATNEFEADGTGIPILKAGKRGKELEILAQRKRQGGIRIAGMVIDGYKQGWKRLFEPLKESLQFFKLIFLVTDGDTSPLAGLTGVTVIIQRCLFHIAHEIKFTLWKDKVKRKSRRWYHVLASTLDITNIRRIKSEQGVLKNIIKWKRNRLTRLINYCLKRKFKHTSNYLLAAQPDIFSGIECKITGGTTSLLERVMRTINQRINVGQWSTESALAVAKIRAGYYYNGFDV